MLQTLLLALLLATPTPRTATPADCFNSRNAARRGALPVHCNTHNRERQHPAPIQWRFPGANARPPRQSREALRNLELAVPRGFGQTKIQCTDDFSGCSTTPAGHARRRRAQDHHPCQSRPNRSSTSGSAMGRRAERHQDRAQQIHSCSTKLIFENSSPWLQRQEPNMDGRKGYGNRLHRHRRSSGLHRKTRKGGKIVCSAKAPQRRERHHPLPIRRKAPPRANSSRPPLRRQTWAVVHWMY